MATGSRYRRLEVPGEEDDIGAGVHFCATCDGPFYKGRTVAVIGGGNSADEESLFLTRFVDRVCLLVRGSELAARRVLVVERFDGAHSKLKAVRIRNTLTGARERMEVPAAFVFIGLDPNTAFLSNAPVQLDAWGFIVTGHTLTHGDDPLMGFEGQEPKAFDTSVPRRLRGR